MSNIILNNQKIKAYEGFMSLGEYAERDLEWLNELWERIVLNESLLNEFIYYLEHHTFADKMDCMGYTMSDMYVFQMNRYNLVRDSGKNTSACNKESMVLNAFYDMTWINRDGPIATVMCTLARSLRIKLYYLIQQEFLPRILSL